MIMNEVIMKKIKMKMKKLMIEKMKIIIEKNFLRSMIQSYLKNL
jgi:hypothetical protein